MSLTRLLLSAALGAALCTPSLPAQAEQNVITAGVVPQTRGSGRYAAQVEQALREELQRRPGMELVPIDRAFSIEEPSGDRSYLEQGAAKLQQGKQAYESMDMEAAMQVLQEAVDDLRNAEFFVDRAESYPEALMYLGAAQTFAGQTAQANKTFFDLLLFNPLLKLPEGKFPDTLTAQFEAVRQKVLALPSGAIAVRSKPTSAKIFLDGRFIGVTPQAITGLKKGMHFLRLEKPGYTPKVQRYGITGGKRQNVKEKMAKAPNADETLRDLALAASADPDAAQAAGRIGLTIGVLTVIAAAATFEEGIVTLDVGLYDAATPVELGRTRTSFPISPGADVSRDVAAMVDELMAYMPVVEQAPEEQELMDFTPVEEPPKTEEYALPDYSKKDDGVGEPPGLLPPGSEPSYAESSDDDDSIVKKWWFWTAIGAAVVAGGATAGAVLGTQDSGSGGGGDATLIFTP